MKIKTIIASLWLVAASSGWALTADDYVAQGRAYLVASNLAAANTSFSRAVALSPDHQAANVLYAATRLLVWPNQPAGSNFLNRLGVLAAGRSLYHWTARLPEDANGVPLAPAGVNANEATAILRTNLLSVIFAADASLAWVTSTNFTINLSAAETQSTDVTLDYGDVLMLRALLEASAYFSYTVYSWNLDAQLSDLRSLYTDGQLNVETLLSKYPYLLAFATTNDLLAARTSFTNAIEHYLEASQFIRNRPASLTRLFNLDATKANAEQKFRVTLADVRNSLNGIVASSLNPAYEMHAASLFSPTWFPRSFLPRFSGDDVALGTWPDPAFGGLLLGYTAQDLTAFAKGKITFISRFGAPGEGFGFVHNELILPFWGQSGYAYLIQLSDDLVNWTDWGVVAGVDGPVQFADPTVAGTGHRFYKAVEYPIWQLQAYVAPPPNDYFYNAEPILDLGKTYVGHNINATTETGEDGASGSAWWTWTAPANGSYMLSTKGSAPCEYASIYTGSRVANLAWVASGNQVFTALAGTTYRIAVGSWCGGGGISLKMLPVPTLVVTTTPEDGDSLIPPAALSIQAVATNSSYLISRMWISTNGTVASIVASNRLNISFSNLGVGSLGEWFNVKVVALDQAGVESSTLLQFRIPPPNDNFSQALPLSGVSVTAYGNPQLGTREPGEPSHGDPYGEGTIWWSWVAPSSGLTTISAWDSRWSYDVPPFAIYTGNSVSELSLIVGNAVSTYDFSPSVSFIAAAGTQYQIVVAGWDPVGLSIVRDTPPSVSITSPTNGVVFAAPTNVTFVASASPGDGSITQVQFLNTSVNPPFLIGAATSPPYTTVWTNPLAGDYSVVACAIDNYGGIAYSFPVSFSIVAPLPVNDNFANRVNITGGIATVYGSNASATKEAGEPTPLGNRGGKSVWWTWTAPKSGSVTISTTGSSFDTIMGVYTGFDVASLSLVAQDDDSGGSLTSRVTFYGSAGTAYQIEIDGYNGGSGTITLNVSQP